MDVKILNVIGFMALNDLEFITEPDIGQVVEHPPVKILIIQWILHIESICSLAYFPFQPVIHNWSIEGPVCGKVHMKDPLLLIGKSSLCSDRGFPLKKYVTMIMRLMSNSRWYENQCALEVSWNKTNFPFYF